MSVEPNHNHLKTWGLCFICLFISLVWCFFFIVFYRSIGPWQNWKFKKTRVLHHRCLRSTVLD